MNILEAIMLGVVQGFTEWLPISSSGHLVIFQELFGLHQPVIFDLFLHLGSLLVIFLVFFKDILKLGQGFFRWEKFYVKYTLWLIVASIPIGFIGYFFNDAVKSAFGSLTVVGFSLIFTSVILFLSKYPHQKNKKLSWKSIVIVGFAQALAILPGVSRSGMTISSGLIQSVKREEAVRFSFLLFIPAILGATILEFKNFGQISNVPALLISFLTTVIVGFFSLKLLLKMVKKEKFWYFGWYCLGLGILVLFFL
jgi:undecaprenyl-diphosphatase